MDVVGLRVFFSASGTFTAHEPHAELPVFTFQLSSCRQGNIVTISRNAGQEFLRMASKTGVRSMCAFNAETKNLSEPILSRFVRCFQPVLPTTRAYFDLMTKVHATCR